jgi:hypothetical protein
MSQDRSQVPYIPSTQPLTVNQVAQIDYRRLGLMAVGLVLLALAAGLYLRQASTVAGYAHDIRALEVRKELLRYEIQALQTDAGQLGSLERLQAAASQLGYHQLLASDTGHRLQVTYPAPASQPGMKAQEATTIASNQVQATNLFHQLWLRFQAWLRADPGT